ncbi:UNVERIFIED_CONTAM: hypothetical protein NY603_16405, partial [Bacteroidetes bacterium 56_B9]
QHSSFAPLFFKILFHHLLDFIPLDFYSRKSIRVFIIQDVQILCAWQNRQIFHPIFGRAGVGRGRHSIPDGAEMPPYKLV